MTLVSYFMQLFPLFTFLGAVAAFISGIWHKSLWSFFGFILILYILPPIFFRFHNFLFPLKEGISNLREKKYSSWWGGHQIQMIYLVFPSLESILRLAPGIYSAWLRLWGSRVGKRVYWTPNVQISDRSFMEIGDDVVFGHKTECYAHAIKKRADSLMLYVAKIRIGNQVFLGGGTGLGPGVKIENEVTLPLLTRLLPNTHMTLEESRKLKWVHEKS